MPAEEEAAARDSVAVTCGQWSRRLLNERSYFRTTVIGINQ